MTPSSQSRLFTSGFTLVELLVSMGIVTLLLAISAVSINIKGSFENAQDTTRKSDLNQLHKAFVQYYVDHKCYPTSDLWNSLTCGGPVPDELKPYLSKIPCDPETNQKYYYEPLDKSCHVCNGGCAVCVGLRILTHLKHQKDPAGEIAGCDPVIGCGINAPDGTPYNYGIATTGNKCPTPTPSPTLTPSPTPAPSITPTPTPLSCPTFPTIGRPCNGQLLTNASFETDVNHDQLPDGWDPQTSSMVVVRQGEGVDCSETSSGSCAYKFLPWISPWSPTKVPELRQTLNISGNAGTAFTFSADALSSNSTGLSGTLFLTVTIYYTDFTKTTKDIDFRGLNHSSWTFGTQTIIAAKAFNKVAIDAIISPSTYTFTLDNVCLTRNNTPTPTPTPETTNCEGQLLSNGSFETPSDSTVQFPNFWAQITSDNIYRSYFYTDEGRTCKTASQGSYAYHLFPFYFPGISDGHQLTMVQDVFANGVSGDKITLSFDGQLISPIQPSSLIYYSNIDLQLMPSDGLPGADKVSYSLTNVLTTEWDKKTFSITATRPFYGILLTIGQPSYPQQMYIDNFCMTRRP
jgi:prepilin-type N-terminal cleavage/methylation domain-containing protein